MIFEIIINQFRENETRDQNHSGQLFFFRKCSTNLVAEGAKEVGTDFELLIITDFSEHHQHVGVEGGIAADFDEKPSQA